MRIHIGRRGREGERNTRVWDRVRRQDQTNALCPSRSRRFSLPLAPCFSLSIRHSRFNVVFVSLQRLFPFTVAPSSLANTLPVSHFCSRAPVVASLFLLASRRRLDTGFSLSRRRSRPLPSALSFRGAASADPSRPRVSIIADKFNFH